jgi:hypothetical protein
VSRFALLLLQTDLSKLELGSKEIVEVNADLLRFLNWLEMLQGTTRRLELCQGMFNWLLEMMKN